MERCKDCKHFETHEHHGARAICPGSGHCSRWHDGYHVKAMAQNEAWVENDEGWGNVVGPEFGCVLFEKR